MVQNSHAERAAWPDTQKPHVRARSGSFLGLARIQALPALRRLNLAELHRLLNMPEDGNAGEFRESIMREDPCGRGDLTTAGRRRSGRTTTLESGDIKTSNEKFLSCSPSKCQAVQAM